MTGLEDVIRSAIEAGKSQDNERSPQLVSEQPGGGSESATVIHKSEVASHARTHSNSTAHSSSVNRHRPSGSWTSRSPTPQTGAARRTPQLGDSPSTRTGPPRSFSYNLSRSPPSTLSTPRQNTLESAVKRMRGDAGGSGLSTGVGLGLSGPGSLNGGRGIEEEDANEDVDANAENTRYLGDIEEDARPRFSHAQSDFRGALEYSSPEQREKEREAIEKRERHRLSRIDDNWLNPLKWLNTADEPTQESPKDDGEGRTGYFDFLKPSEGKGKEKETEDEMDANEKQGGQDGTTSDKKPLTPNGDAKQRAMSHDTGGEGSSRNGKLQSKGMSRAQSMPHIKRSNSRKASLTNASSPKAAPRWNRLRSLLPALVQQGRQESTPGQVAVQQTVVNITDELITGNLSALMLKLWFERDERDHRRIPVLLHRLRVRISDSLHPLGGNKAVFRIECEYANGAARWVVYRQLRDFISLHRSYRLSNAYNRNVDALPEFPWSSVPYLKFLKKDERDINKASFAVQQRQALEDYLIGLIRAVMFHPTSNRLCGFLEISALFVQLAQSGGWQTKAGMLRIEAASNKSGGFGRKNASWSDKKKQRWCAVRDGYLVAVEEPGEVKIWDVFLLDSDFKTERPTRVYRQGLNLLHHGHLKLEAQDMVNKDNHPRLNHHLNHHVSESHGTISKLKSKLARALHLSHVSLNKKHSRQGSSTTNGDARSGGRDRHSTTNASFEPNRTRSMSMSSMSSASSSSSGGEPGMRTPMVDPSTNMNPMRDEGPNEPQNPEDSDLQKKKRKKRSDDVSKHTFFISNSQMRLKCFAKNERQMQQWITALEKTAAASHWTGSNRFDSFAPIRLNVAAQWLVDGRDYMWNLSRAILLARERIYIHDWWLSPELQMRRPHKERYRLDKLLERKAKEGVKIYVILYQEVSNRTTPTDSNYSKQRLMSLHPNIMVQRSPSHFQTGTFYWAHHEKLCVIDEAIAFMGGIDLCFGRWDTPQHVLVDDPDLEEEGSSQIWLGKDYSNPRISDFHTLNKPDEDMYDRSKIPRMPWHDVGMHVVGQPARDLCRHFVQRWNSLLRIKNHSRTMPFLLPPPEFKLHDLQDQGLTGTCEMQICRSAGPWSMGTPYKTESSIQNAYLKAIQLSDHFVYIENQFFITSTIVNDTVIENKIGDALVNRIIRAYREGTKWKACIVIPLLPGFPYPVDHGDASAVRIILECQNRTICRGPNSIFSRLRKEGIDPDEYISVFCLRNWAKMPGNVLTTEMVYIHGKVCIVDDRLAIIGSANINERSQRGDRDSELAAVIRDTDMLDSTMDGKPYKVGRFAHTLRVRLMREHLGVDVDSMYEEDLMSGEPVKETTEEEAWDPDNEQHRGQEQSTHAGAKKKRTAFTEGMAEIKDTAKQALVAAEDAADRDVVQFIRKMGVKTKGVDGSTEDKEIEEERTDFTKDGDKEHGFASSKVPTLEEKTILEHRSLPEQSKDENTSKEADGRDGKSSSAKADPPEARVHDGSEELYGAPADASKNAQTDDEPPHARSGKIDATEEEKAAVHARQTIRKHLSTSVGNKAWALPTRSPEVDPHGFEDPISDAFWKNVWVACAVHNTEIYRKVFHAVPDDIITTWKQYKEFVQHHERLNKPIKEDSRAPPVGRVPSEAGDADALGQDEKEDTKIPGDLNEGTDMKRESSTERGKQSTPPADGQDEHRRIPSRIDEPFEKWERDEMEELLHEIRGHLVVYPTRFLEGEDVANNFLFNADRLLPMPIYD